MKKKSIVLGSLLAAVVLTGYSVSGTYAKYVSAVDLSDEARVAKWEIGLSDATDKKLNLFKDSYEYESNGVVVKSLTTKTLEDGTEVPTRVIAPGTKGQYTFALSGIIETNYKIQVTATGDNTVVLKDDGGNVTYSPVRFYLSEDDKLDITTMAYDDLMDFDTLKAELNKLYSGANGKVYAPGEVDKTSHTIYWTWNFEGNDDVKDTILGNEIVEDETSHTLDLSINITATQTREAVTNEGTGTTEQGTEGEDTPVVTPEETDPEQSSEESTTPEVTE